MNIEKIKHTYIVALLKGIIIVVIPLFFITFYFNLIYQFRPVAFVSISLVLSVFVGIYWVRDKLSAKRLSVIITALLLIAANINCYVNASIAHAGVAALSAMFAISVIQNKWFHLGVIVITAVSLYFSFNFAHDFTYPTGYDRWLLVTAAGQILILSGMRILFHSIKEMFEQEHKLRLASEAAARAKSRFLANMSHEIRTPIAGIIGMLDLVNETSLTKQQKMKVTLASQSADLLSRIVNDILDYSKIEAGKLSVLPIDFEITELMKQTLSVIQPKLNENKNKLVFKKNWTEKLWLKGDKTRLQQILLNLLSNAGKFTHEGTIQLTITLTEHIGHYDLHCEVRDTGVGMSEEQLSQLFQPFHQLDNSSTKPVQGTGLGLLISKQILDLMDGELAVESELNEGSTFSFTVQLLKGSPSDSKNTDITSAEFSELSVLVVEDNAINQTILIEMLSNMGISCELAEDGEKAIEYLQKNDRESVDIILMDCQMPVMDGYTATQRIRNGKAGHDWTDIPIIALTANALDGDRETCIDAGMDEYLTKPIQKDKLLQTLHKSFSKKTYTA